MTPVLRTQIIDALLQQWPEEEHPIWLKLDEPLSRKYIESMLDMILPTVEPMIRQATLLEAVDIARAVGLDAAAHIRTDQSNWFVRGEMAAANMIRFSILDLVENKIRDERIERAAISLWIEEAASMPEGVRTGRNAQTWPDNNPETHAKWRRFARAALMEPATCE